MLPILLAGLLTGLLTACTGSKDSDDTGQSIDVHVEAHAIATCDFYWDCEVYGILDPDDASSCDPNYEICFYDYEHCLEVTAEQYLAIIDDPDRCPIYQPVMAEACVADIGDLSCDDWQTSWPDSCASVCSY